MNTEKNPDDFNLTELILFLIKWRKPLLIVTFFAAVAAIVFSTSYFIKPKFESSVIFFPGSATSISKALFTEGRGVKNDIMKFGEEEEAEQLIQILNSDLIKSRDRKSTRLNSSHIPLSRMPSSA